MSWDGFLKSLETEGGKMFIVLVLVFFLLGSSAILLITGHPLQEVGRELITGTVGSLLGILYGYLKAGGTK